MKYKITSLENTPLSEITRCFNEAFSDYFVKFIVDEKHLRTRWEIARVDYSLSFGAFDGEQLIGFIMHGIGERNGQKTAHNSATGIEPPYRGKGLLGEIYKAAINALKKAEIEQSILEVISINERAIKAYEKVGFKLCPELLHCFKGSIKNTTSPPANIEIRKVNNPNWQLYSAIPGYALSWEMTPEALSIFPANFEYRELWKKGEFGGYLIHSPNTGLIQQFNIRPDWRRQGLGKLLLFDLAKKTPQLRVNNVPKSATETVQFLNNIGFENHIDQYEMEMEFLKWVKQ